MKSTLTLLLTGALCALAVSFSPPAREAPAEASEAKTYEIDPVHSSVLFRTKHFGVTYFYGRFNSFSGEIVYDDKKPGESSILLVVDANSVDSKDDGRDRHLKSPDFFSVKEFPEIVFESTGVKKKKDKLEVTGNLTLHGITKEVTALVEHTGTGQGQGGEIIGFEGEFTIDAKDYEIQYMTQSSGALGPEVKLIISVEAKLQ